MVEMMAEQKVESTAALMAVKRVLMTVDWTVDRKVAKMDELKVAMMAERKVVMMAEKMAALKVEWTAAMMAGQRVLTTVGWKVEN